MGPEGPSTVYSLELTKSSGETVTSPENASKGIYSARSITLSNLPAGTYAITAKAAVQPIYTEPPPVPTLADCVLSAGEAKDYTAAVLPSQPYPVTLVTELVHTFKETGSVTLTCSALTEKFELLGGTTGGTTKIVAIKVREGHEATTEEATETTISG